MIGIVHYSWISRYGARRGAARRRATPRELIRRQVRYVEKRTRVHPTIIIYDPAWHRDVKGRMLSRGCTREPTREAPTRVPSPRPFPYRRYRGSLANNACKRRRPCHSISHIVMSAHKYAPPSATIRFSRGFPHQTSPESTFCTRSILRRIVFLDRIALRRLFRRRDTSLYDLHNNATL